jgi:uncharacterized protein (TIGR02611 family)
LTVYDLQSKADQFRAKHQSTLIVANDVMNMRPDSRNGQPTPKDFGVNDSPSWMKWYSRIWNTENIKLVRRVIVSVIGATVLLIGIALLVLPGPAFIVIPLGLAILATEYAWARRWLRKVRRMASNVVSSRERPAPKDSVV